MEIYEKVNCTFSRDGTFKGIEVNGEIFIIVQDPSKSKVAIQLLHENNKAFGINAQQVAQGRKGRPGGKVEDGRRNENSGGRKGRVKLF